MALGVRTLTAETLPLIWTIDRREHIDNIYRLRDGELVPEPHDFDVPGWGPGQESSTMPGLLAALDRGGTAWGVFDGETLVAAAVVDVKPVGVRKDLLQLQWLHVSRDYRGRGLGVALFEKAMEVAGERGAAGLYISATPTTNTVHFYLGRGARLVAAPDPDLFTLEPEDIHLEWRLESVPE